LGYIYWRLNDYGRAAETYEKGAKISGAPPFLLVMASKMKSAGGDRETARAIYEQMLAESPDRQVRDNAALHLGGLDSEDERDAVRLALQTFKAKTNRCAENWREILPLLQTVKLPRGRKFRVDNAGSVVDPGGTPYLLDRENCDVKLDEAKTKIPFK
jgi:tetratricopeptide (TPR) repeat protein